MTSHTDHKNIASSDPRILLKSVERLPGSCLSLIYCSYPLLLSNVKSDVLSNIEINQKMAHIEFVYGYSIFSHFKKFKSKKLFAKLMLLLALGRKFLIAVNSNHVIGLLGIRFDKLTNIRLGNNDACIYTVLVSNECRGFGLGGMLVNMAAIKLMKEGCNLVLLETGEHNNSMIHLLGCTELFQFFGFVQRPLPMGASKKIAL